MPIRVVRMRKVSFIDSTGLHNLEIFIKSSQNEGRVIILSGVHENVEKSLRKSGIVKIVGKENVCRDIHLALDRAKQVAEEKGLEK